MSTFYDEIREAATRLNLEIGNHYSDLYIEARPEILEIAVKHGKAKKHVRRASRYSPNYYESYSGLDRFTCQITGKPMIDFPFAFAPYWDAKQKEAARRASLNVTLTLTPES